MIMQAYSHFRHHFSGAEQLQQQVAQLQHHLKEQKLQTLIALERAEDLRQSVAAVLTPDMMSQLPDHQTQYQARAIASVVQDGELERIENPQRLLARGKELFRRNKFSEAIEVFEQVADDFPASPAAPEALFLAVESQFQLQRKTPMIQVVERMMARYPENDLTGFALLRVSELFITEGRKDDAAEIIETVVINFKNVDLLKQADTFKKRL